MPVPIACTICGAKYVAPDAATNRKVKCKECRSSIAVPIPAVAEESGYEIVDPRPVVVAKPVMAVPRPKAIPVPPAEVGKPEMRVEEDDVPRNRKRTKPDHEAVDDDRDYVAPRKTRNRGKKAATAKGNPIIFVIVGFAALVVVGVVGGAVWYVAIRDEKQNAAGTMVPVPPASPNRTGGSPGPFVPVVQPEPETPPAPVGWTKYSRPSFIVCFKDSIGTPEPRKENRNDTKLDGLSVGTGTDATNAMMILSTEMKPDVYKFLLTNPSQILDKMESIGGGGTLIYRKQISIEGNFGREIKHAQKNGVESVFRIVLAHNRIYTFGFFESKITPSSETYRMFFDSVKLKP